MLIAMAVVFTSVAVGCFIDYLCHQWIYGKEAYSSLAGKVARANAHLEDVRSRPGGKDKSSRVRLIEDLEKALSGMTQELAAFSMRAMLLQAVSSMLLFLCLRTLLAGVIVATLPFEPIAIFRAMALADPKADPRGASWLFFFVLSNSSIKPLVSKVCGWQVRRVRAMWAGWPSLRGRARVPSGDAAAASSPRGTVGPLLAWGLAPARDTRASAEGWLAEPARARVLALSGDAAAAALHHLPSSLALTLQAPAQASQDWSKLLGAKKE